MFMNGTQTETGVPRVCVGTEYFVICSDGFDEEDTLPLCRSYGTFYNCKNNS